MTGIELLIVLLTLWRDLLESFLLHLRPWIDVLGLEVEPEELSSLLFVILNILFFLIYELARLVYLVTFFVAYKFFRASIEAVVCILLSMQGYPVSEDPWRVFGPFPPPLQEVEYEFQFEFDEAADAPTRTPPLPPHILQDLPLSTMAESTEICTICHEPYRTGEAARTLPCDHFFHAICVDYWLLSEHGDCLLCKQAVV